MKDNVFYEVMTGSVAYGCNEENTSDKDVYAVCIPPKEIIFPHLSGHIDGFGSEPQRFEQYQQHHIKDDVSEYDINVYNIVKYFDLCMKGNPNMVDTLFVPQRCVLWCNQIGQRIRDNRKLFLSKISYHKFRGYAYSQLHAIKTRTPLETSKRREKYDQFGFDVKYAYHVVRLCLECEQILSEGEITLDRDREIYKAIRRGDWSQEKITEFFEEKEKYLERLYETSSVVPYKYDEEAIKSLLIECLEMHYKTLPLPKELNKAKLLEKVLELYDMVKSSS